MMARIALVGDDGSGGAEESAPIRPSQLLRRARILDVALELAAAGGYDAVQMREVAEQAGVALGTLYRYFPSKTSLLVSALARQLAEWRDAALADQRRGGSAGERLYRVLAWVMKALEHERLLSAAMVRAMMSADATVADEVDEANLIMISIIASAGNAPGEQPTEREVLVASIVGKVWLVDILTWLTGRMSVNDVLADLRQTIDTLMP